MNTAEARMKLQAAQQGGWHTVTEFCRDQEGQIQAAAYLADIARVTMRILDDGGALKCMYEPGVYAANPATPSTWWRPLQTGRAR